MPSRGSTVCLRVSACRVQRNIESKRCCFMQTKSSCLGKTAIDRDWPQWNQMVSDIGWDWKKGKKWYTVFLGGHSASYSIAKARRKRVLSNMGRIFNSWEKKNCHPISCKREHCITEWGMECKEERHAMTDGLVHKMKCASDWHEWKWHIAFGTVMRWTSNGHKDTRESVLDVPEISLLPL